MFIRNGIKSNLRERGRTALFSLLIVFLTVTVTLSLSLLMYCNSVLEACDKEYRSIALVEYMGSEYPNTDEPDPAARAAAEKVTDDAILSLPGVRGWTRGNTSFGTTEGYERRIAAGPYGNRAVLVVSNFSAPVYQEAEWDEEGNPIITEDTFYYHTCLLNTILYSRNGRENTFVNIMTGSSGFIPEKGKTYILNVAFVETSGSSQQVGTYPMNGLPTFRVEFFLEADDLPYKEYKKGEEVPLVFTEAAKQYSVMNDFVYVVPCKDVRDVYAFQQNEIQLVEGAMPDPEEPLSCVISQDISQSLNLVVGDSFDLEELKGKENDRYYLNPTGEKKTYTVRGITAESLDHFGTLWVIDENADSYLFGYLIGTCSLANDTAVETVDALQEMMPEQVRVTLLDQGYGNAVQPFREVKSTAVNVLLVCSAGALAVLLLFAFLFVGRQSETVKIMVSLGTPGRKIALWFISGILVIAGGSALVGAVLGIALRPTLLRIISENIEKIRGSVDALWYSETSLGVVKETSFEPQVPLWPNILAALGILILALLFCLLFLRMARKSGTRKQGKSRVHVPRGATTTFGGGGLRFALLSIRRGGLRSLVVPVVSLMLTVTVILLGGVYQSWQNRLSQAVEETSIDGMVVSLNGRYYSGLSLSIDSVRSLMEVDDVRDVSVSSGNLYWLEGDMPVFGTGEFAQMHRQDWIARQPELVALNALAAAKEFYYSDPAVTWLSGWDESMLSETELTSIYIQKRVVGHKEPQKDEALEDEAGSEAEECSSAEAQAVPGPDDEVVPAVCSSDFLESHKLSLGDTFSVMIQYEDVSWYGYPMEVSIFLKAVGSYVQQEGKANIYVPLSFHIPKEFLKGEREIEGMNTYISHRLFDRLSFRTCRFRLASARDLDGIRTRLKEQGFSAVGHLSRNRTTLLFRDAAFLKLRESMERNIAMGRVMSTGISLLVVLLGFIISWLMTFSRRSEFALMRAFGAKKFRVFTSFFLEQAILSFIGCLIGCLALIPLYGGGITQPLAVGAYLVCYLVGTVLSIWIVGKTDLMELLTVKE